MPLKPRFYLPCIPAHIVQRGNNRSACFYAEEDYRCYLYTLQEQAQKYGCLIHSYVLMSNHVHLLRMPAKEESAALLTQHLGQRYVSYINRTYRDAELLREIRTATNGNCVPGSERFKEEVAHMLMRRVVPGKSGRPLARRG